LSTFLFVYGTLLPGAQSWELVEPFVEGHGIPDSVRGELFDTGLGYPAAVVDQRSTNTVYGRTMQLIAIRSAEALRVLDDFEDVSDGLFRRVVVRTDQGCSAWVYVAGEDLQLTRIPSGDWLRRDHPH
jgi:gamma-glutamylcyclotransferase (GGCT)/AIG2-like uncharacterized protein YtfP